jgi:hypothetical protein
MRFIYASTRPLSTLPVGSVRRSWLNGQRLTRGLVVAAVTCLTLSGSLVFRFIPELHCEATST